MRVVGNTSPISNLAILGRLDLLRQRHGTISIPLAVVAELDRLQHPAGKAHVDAARAAGWLHLDATVHPTLSLPFALHAGEAAAISLAVGTRADVLLMDERRGRTAARHFGLTVAGVLGELLHGKFAGRLPALRPEIQRLRDEAGFFIDPGIERFILSQAGE